MLRTAAIEGGFGVVVHGAELVGDGLTETVSALEDLLNQHLLVVLGGACLDNDQYIALGKAFGELEDFASINASGHTLAISNVAMDGQIRAADDPMRANISADALWHTDHTYMVRRARYSFLSAEIVPASGGDTLYANTRAAYDDLPDDMKRRIDGLVALHSIVYSRSLVGATIGNEELRKKLHPVPQPLVFRNPVTGRKSLYVASHIAEINGMPANEARELAAELIAHATQPKYVYTHRWRPGDIVIWDDRATMHRRADYDDLNEVRKLHTMRVLEDSDLYDPQVTYEYT